MAKKVIRKEQGGQHVQLHVGDVLEIQLPENGTTGFVWQLAPHAAWQVSRRFQPAGSQPGAAGTACIEMKLLRKLPGTVVKLELRRPWETNEPPAECFEFRLSVNE
ncbi:MAG: protease inhibitor I42 family protein [Chitinophagaceae bacterium]|jgi:predicted secreted protein|nr:protease inhibitor I42 family protein [Chitinophagaceae bacterium]